MAKKSDSANWLTSLRLRAHGLIVGAVLWSIYVWTIATPGLRDRYGNLKGTDFLHFYTLGWIAHEHRGTQLYDMRAQAELASAHVPQAVGIFYLPLYPPQVSILFAPFAHLPYARALAVWWLVSAVIYFACCHWTWRACPNLARHRATVIILCAAFPAFFHLIAWGQTSPIALLCFTAMYFSLRSRRAFLAGVVFGCLAFKPQLALAGAIIFVASGAWRVVTGAALSAAAQFLAGVLYYGTQVLHDWLWMIRNLRAALPFLEPKIYQTHCLRTFWSMLLPRPTLAFTLYAISAVAVLFLTISLWRRRNISLPVRYSALLIATVLVAPHLTVYDLVILAPAILLLSDQMVAAFSKNEGGKIGAALYAVYVLPLIGPLAQWTHVQLSVVAMAAVLFFIWREGNGKQTVNT
jgi:alpha-1,2-mannosyltransferase